MALALGSAPRFRRRLLGYDRREVEVALTSTGRELERAVARRDELIASTTNVQRIGAEVAEMLRSLADRAVEVEAEASAKAERLIDEARDDAAAIRAEAAAVLAAAHAEAEQLREASRTRQATVGRRRESALTALHVAMNQIRQLTKTVEELEIEPPVADAPEPTRVVSVDQPPDAEADTVVLLPWSASGASEESTPEPADDPIDPVLSRITSWAGTSP